MNQGRPDRGDRGSTIPLILGCFLLAMVMVAGSIAAGQAFVQQRDLQSMCDGAAAAAAASGDLAAARGMGDVGGDRLRLGNVQQAVDGYLARDGSRRGVSVQATLTADARTVDLVCVNRTPLAFGSVFGYGDGVRHRATSAAQAPVTP